MKGRSTFTNQEIVELRRLINRKNSLPSDQQKAIRDQMRDIGFYITDFSPKKGFECEYLDLLIKSGAVKIQDRNSHHPEPVNSITNNLDTTQIKSVKSDSDFLERNQFFEYLKYQDYKVYPNLVRKIPDVKGVYAVVTLSDTVEFLSKGTGGFFKERDPNVPNSVLQSNWVENANILYIGKAGGISKNGTESSSTLRRRLNTYFKFGQGEPVGHWGGRLIWQLKNSDKLLFYWRACREDENPVELEHQLIAEFKKYFGKKPFANLTD